MILDNITKIFYALGSICVVAGFAIALTKAEMRRRRRNRISARLAKSLAAQIKRDRARAQAVADARKHG